MITVEEHLSTILTTVRRADPVLVPVEQAHGCVLAADAVAAVDLPGFANSAMDGYAVRAADTTSAEDGVELEVVGEVAAGGDAAGLAVGPGQAVRIMTGAMMPDGADAVVRVEDTDGGTDRVRVTATVTRGRSVRSAGEDVRRGELVLAAGSFVDARRLALLAASGLGEVLVVPQPRVAVVSTGDELVDPGNPLAPGQIHDSNSRMLQAALHEAGVREVRRLHASDDPEALLELLTELAGQVDAIVSTGGVSMGAYDVVKAALREHGVDFVQVAMQPGKPQGFGLLTSGGAEPGRAVPIFALPGNPVSAYVSYELFVRPALRAMAGIEPAMRATHEAQVTAAMHSPRGRRQIARAVATQGSDGSWTADPVWGQGSHFIADLSRANAFVVVPEQVREVAPGDRVELWLLDGAERVEGGVRGGEVQAIES